MTPPASPDLPDLPHRPLRVLVAEDNPINQRMVAAFLEQRGHASVMAADGRDDRLPRMVRKEQDPRRRLRRLLR